jgi:hypothetical protein
MVKECRRVRPRRVFLFKDKPLSQRVDYSERCLVFSE